MSAAISSTARLEWGEDRLARLLLLLLMMAFLLVAVLSSPGITVTLDEPLHYHYGLFVLDGKTDRIDDSSMPVSALNALPAYLAASLPNGALKAVLGRYFTARLVTILAAALFSIVVFKWSRTLYGLTAAVFSTTLYVLDPNIIAHSQLVTTDVFAAGMFALSMYQTWRFANTKRVRDGLVCALVIGLSQLVKYTAVALIPLAIVALAIHDWPVVRGAARARGVRGGVGHLGRLCGYLLAGVAISALLVNIGFLFNRSFTPLRDYRFRSELFRSIQADVPALGGIPIPLPYPYLEGLDWMRDTEQTANRYGNVYLLGHLSKPRGFPGYYFVATALKLPIASQVTIMLALGIYVLDRRRNARFLENEVFLLLPAAALATYFNFFFNAQTGIRYYLVVFPFLYVFAGSLFVGWRGWTAPRRAASAVLVGYLAVSVLSYFPYFTPYFNESVWDKTQTYKYLSDTNLEWGQSQDDLKRYLAHYPDAVYDPQRPQAGRLVVGGSDLVGILEDPGKYEWLRGNFEPLDTVAYCYFVYVITPEEIEKLCVATSFCR